MTGTERTVTRLRMPDKTNKITRFAALLVPFDLEGGRRDRGYAAHPAHARPVPGRGEKGPSRARGQGPPARCAPHAAATTLEGRHRPAPPARHRARSPRDPGDPHAHRHRPRPGPPPRRPGREDHPPPRRPQRPGNEPGRPSTRSPTCPTSRPHRSGSESWPVRNGPPRTDSTSSATPPSARTPPRSAPATAPRTRPPCTTSRSTPPATTTTPASPPAPTTSPTSPSPARSTSSTSRDQPRRKITRTLNQPRVDMATSCQRAAEVARSAACGAKPVVRRDGTVTACATRVLRGSVTHPRTGREQP